MNEIVISRIPMPSVEEQIKLIQTEKNHHNTPQTPPLTTQPSNYVSRETSPNTQPTTKNLTVKPTQKDPQQTNHQKAVTHRSLFSRWKNPFMPTDDKLERIRYCLTFP